MSSDMGPWPPAGAGPPPAGPPEAAPPPPPEGGAPPEPETPRLQRVQEGLSDATVALRLGFWIVNHQPGLLVLFVLPILVTGVVNFGMTRGLGLSQGSLTFTTVFILVSLFAYTPVMAAAILEAEARRTGGSLSHREALREGLRNLRFILIPALVVWFGVEAVGQLILLSIPVSPLFAGDPDQAVSVLSVVVPAATVAQTVAVLYFVGRLLIALPDRVLSEEDPPRLWPALLVLGLVAARFAVAGSAQELAQASEETVAGSETAGIGAVAAVSAVSVALLAIFLLALFGKIPAGLRWSWEASRDLDLQVASLALVVMLLLATPRPWVLLTTSAGGVEQVGTGLMLYLLAIFLIAGIFGQWGLGLVLSGSMAAILYVALPLMPLNRATHQPLVNPFTIGANIVIPLTLLTVSTVSLYAQTIEAE